MQAHRQPSSPPPESISSESQTSAGYRESSREPAFGRAAASWNASSPPAGGSLPTCCCCRRGASQLPPCWQATTTLVSQLQRLPAQLGSGRGWPDDSGAAGSSAAGAAAERAGGSERSSRVQTQALLLAPPSHAAAGQPGARGAGAPATAAAPRLGACAARSATAACVEACHERYRGRRLAGNATAAQARHAGRRAVGRVEGRRRHRPHPAATCCLRGCRPWHCLSPGPLRLLGGPGAGPGTCIAAVAYPCNCGRGARQVTHSLRRIASKSDTCCAAASPHLSSPAMYWPCASSCICSPRCACTGRQARHRLGCRE